MSTGNSTARRYHWHSAGLRSFVEEPHTAICGINQGEILNLTDHQAGPARTGVLSLTQEKPELMMRDAQQLLMQQAPASVNPAVVGATHSAVVNPAYPAAIAQQAQRMLTLPGHHDVRAEDVDLRRLGAVLCWPTKGSPPISRNWSCSKA